METLFDVAPAAINEETRSGLLTSAAGRACELLVAARLLELGHKVAVPIVDDDGIDLIVNYRTTVQVKSSRLVDVAPASLRGRYRYFVFKSIRWAWNADVFVFRGVEPGQRDAWWIVPSSVLRDTGVKGAISLLPPGTSSGKFGKWSPAFAPYVDRWELFDG